MFWGFAIRQVVFSASLLLAVYSSAADVAVRYGNNANSVSFEFDHIPRPAKNDLGESAKWYLIDGIVDANSGPTSTLSDGKIPESQDSPRDNLFLSAGTPGGSLVADLGESVDIDQVVSYSWHPGSRAAQRYRFYAATGLEQGFDPSQLGTANPTDAGWILVATVDSRQPTTVGGQHAVQIGGDAQGIGSYRYLRLDIEPTDAADRFSHTFFCEVDIVSKGTTSTLERLAPRPTQIYSFATPDQRYEFVLDTTHAPDLSDWSRQELQPVIESWYPRIVAMFPSEDYTAARKVTFRYLPESEMRGIPAWAQNATISLNASWYRQELEREARGAVVHEMVHVVQAYQNRGRRSRGIRQNPSWLVEGIPDYVRWFLYEPESRGAVLSKRALQNAQHDASYRVSANFLDWVIRNQDKNGDFLPKLNATLREGKYSSDIWVQLTGKSEEELAQLWKEQ